jgi:hypothetical protein
LTVAESEGTALDGPDRNRRAGPCCDIGVVFAVKGVVAFFFFDSGAFDDLATFLGDGVKGLALGFLFAAIYSS